MPQYTYRCPAGHEFAMVMTFEERDQMGATVSCPHHLALAQQVLSFSFHRGMPEHFNHSAGAYVTNSHALDSELSRQSDEMSERMGFTVAYEPIDGHDPAAHGVTDQGLDATRRQEVDSGAVAPKLYL